MAEERGDAIAAAAEHVDGYSFNELEVRSGERHGNGSASLNQAVFGLRSQRRAGGLRDWVQLKNTVNGQSYPVAAWRET